MQLSLGNESATEKLTWNIKNFNYLSLNEGLSFKSSIIHQRHARKVWRFFLQPSCRSDKNYMAAYFGKAYSNFDPMIYNGSLSIRSLNGNPIKSFEFQCVDLQNSYVGRDKCLRRNTIENLLKGSVTVQFEITEVSPKSFFSTVVNDFENLSSDFIRLYQFPMFHDLIIRIQHSSFFLHTCVLYARCRRLSHVFGYQSFKQMPNFVQINDICPSLFYNLLIYIYSGKLEAAKLTLGLFMFADKLKLQALKQLVYEKVQKHRMQTEIATETVTITWNLKEIQFWKKDGIPFVQIFRMGCCTTHLVVRIGISEHSDGENYIDFSFKVFLDTLYKPISLLCAITLFCEGEVCAYKKDSCSIKQDEEWHFPLFIKINDIPESNSDYVPDMCLTAEVSLSDGCAAYNNLHTNARLFTECSLNFYPERLGSDMRRLLSAKVVSRFKKHDIILKTVDNCYIPAHKVILWARWPKIRSDLWNRGGENESYLPINLYSEELKMLLNYIYTGTSYFKNSLADKVLEANARIEYPPYLVRKCRNLIRQNRMK